MTERREYKPGDTFRWDAYEVVALHDNDKLCDHCVGELHNDICDALPTGCLEDEIVWRPSNEAASLMVVILKL